MKILTKDAINELRHNARSVVRELGLLNEAYFDIGVTLAERHILLELNNSGLLTMGELANRLLIDKSTISRLISKAVKKGYLRCNIDAQDRRKRFLELTAKGIETLNAFEPIAFKQTQNALLTLNTDQIATVYNGVALYAQGLKSSRLQLQGKPVANDPNNNKITLSDIHKQLRELGYVLDLYTKNDEAELYQIFKHVVDSGSQFPYESSSIEAFHQQFINAQSKVYVCRSIAGEVIGGFFLRANFSGRSNHIANAAYMIKEKYRGQGIGSLLIKGSLLIAKNLGFKAMQFNMVLSENTGAIRLYQKLQFKIAGVLPDAIRKPDGSYQDGYVMYRKLDNI
jgi:DNA-binding MarR family transcriptional regulator/ribosomal protein S18 acetylase RimI-like enzyme